MSDVRGLLVTALGSPLLPASAVRTVSQSKPLTLLDPALSAGVANEFAYLSAPLAPKILQSRERSDHTSRHLRAQSPLRKSLGPPRIQSSANCGRGGTTYD